MVDFIKGGCVDLGAQEINVSGVCSVERVTEGQVRISYFLHRKGENVTVVHLVWDRKEWLKMWKVWDEMRHCLEADRFVEDGIMVKLGLH